MLNLGKHQATLCLGQSPISFSQYRNLTLMLCLADAKRKRAMFSPWIEVLGSRSMNGGNVKQSNKKERLCDERAVSQYISEVT